MVDISNMSDEEVINEILSYPRNLLDIACKRLKAIERDEYNIKSGKYEMINHMSNLIYLLNRDHRLDELEKAADDSKYLESLIREYHTIDILY